MKRVFFLFLYDLIIKIVNFYGRSGKLLREFCQLIMFAIWYLPRFGNLFIQSAEKCTCTNFILQKSETTTTERKSLTVMSNYGNDLACHFF